MKQTIFTTRQRAEELLEEAIAIWKHSYSIENLEGIERDPVFSLFLTALAYEVNELDAEIEQLRADIFQEFAKMLIPYNQTHALPASAVVEVKPNDQIPTQVLDHRTNFVLSKTPYTFIPLLRTQLFNGEIASIVRLDNRRWKVSLHFKDPVENLSGMTFLVNNPHFRDLKLFVNGRALPLVKPWDYADLPLDRCFSLENMIYSQSLIYQARNTWFDLFAKQNVRLFYVDTYKLSSQAIPSEKVDLVFEFLGIDDEFKFDKEQLFLNCTILVNAQERSVTLSSNSPIARISGGDETTLKWQFMHMIRPSNVQLFHEEPVEIRKIAADRFNPERLMKLASSLISRFTSDYYAFQQMAPFNEGSFKEQFYALLKRISDGVSQASEQMSSGLYIVLKNNHRFHVENVSLEMNYLMTNGSEVNQNLDEGCSFEPISASFIKSTRLLAEPVFGYDEIQGADAEGLLSRYYWITNDRIVTPSDIKIFCYNELETRFGITNDLIEKIKVKPVQYADYAHCGYEIQVHILLKNSSYVKRSFEGKIPKTEMILQKMIEVRSMHIFPVQVNIEIQ